MPNRPVCSQGRDGLTLFVGFRRRVVGPSTPTNTECGWRCIRRGRCVLCVCCHVAQHQVGAAQQFADAEGSPALAAEESAANTVAGTPDLPRQDRGEPGTGEDQRSPTRPAGADRRVNPRPRRGGHTRGGHEQQPFGLQYTAATAGPTASSSQSRPPADSPLSRSRMTVNAAAATGRSAKNSTPVCLPTSVAVNKAGAIRAPASQPEAVEVVRTATTSAAAPSNGTCTCAPYLAVSAPTRRWIQENTAGRPSGC